MIFFGGGGNQSRARAVNGSGNWLDVFVGNATPQTHPPFSVGPSWLCLESSAEWLMFCPGPKTYDSHTLVCLLYVRVPRITLVILARPAKSGPPPAHWPIVKIATNSGKGATTRMHFQCCWRILWLDPFLPFPNSFPPSRVLGPNVETPNTEQPQNRRCKSHPRVQNFELQ